MRSDRPAYFSRDATADMACCKPLPGETSLRARVAMHSTCLSLLADGRQLYLDAFSRDEQQHHFRHSFMPLAFAHRAMLPLSLGRAHYFADDAMMLGRDDDTSPSWLVARRA